MCGINGFNFEDKKLIEKMNGVLTHRGPDDKGVLIGKNISLGHQRLSIIDLSKKGHQPMNYSLNKNKFSIVFNGEIYNYKELKKELVNLGHKFNSDSDTEVILASYAEWGEDCVNKFNGMWAFCIYDSAKKIFFLSRDRLGQKPLYYLFDGKKFIFSSEIKGILKHTPKLHINNDATDLYLSLGFIPAPYSIYKGVLKLEAAQNITFDLQTKKLTKKTYYNYPTYNPTYDKKKLKKEFHELLKDATRLRMIADVPLGAFLSGGLDSSIVVYQMLNLQNEKKVSTFSIEMKGCNDSKYIDVMKNRFNLKNIKKDFNEKDFNRIKEKVFNYYDEPFADYSLFPTFLLSEMTSKEVKVALSGDGADELFGGYEHYNSVAKLAFLKKTPRILRKITLILLPRIKKTYLIREGLKRSLLNSEDLFSEAWEGIYKPQIAKDLTQKKMREMLKLSKGNLVEAMMLFDRYFKTQGDNFLCKIDRASMANSLEIRSPFLDYRFLEYASHLPTKWKANMSTTKIFMKEVVKDFLPKGVVYRKKEGFNSPLLEQLINRRVNNKNIKKIIRELSNAKIISSEWEKFYYEKITNTQDPIFNKYRIRLLLLHDWFNTWKKHIVIN